MGRPDSRRSSEGKGLRPRVSWTAQLRRPSWSRRWTSRRHLSDRVQDPVLPVWLPAECVGGKSVVVDCESAGGEYSVAELSKALRAASQYKRNFKSMEQWAAVFIKYALSAVSMKQLTWQIVTTHMSIIFRHTGEVPPSFAILHDELIRKGWRKRAECKDWPLNLLEEAGQQNNVFFELAKSRLDSVLDISGVTPRKESTMPPFPRRPRPNSQWLRSRSQRRRHSTARTKLP